MRAGHGVDVGTIRSLGPDPEHAKAQDASSCGPFHVPYSICSGDLLTGSGIPVQNLVVPRVGDKAAAVLSPIQVGDKTGMALWGREGTELELDGAG